MHAFLEQSILNKSNIFEPECENLWFVPELGDRVCESAEELFCANWKEWEVAEIEETGI